MKKILILLLPFVFCGCLFQRKQYEIEVSIPKDVFIVDKLKSSEYNEVSTKGIETVAIGAAYQIIKAVSADKRATESNVIKYKITVYDNNTKESEIIAKITKDVDLNAKISNWRRKEYEEE